ncbi:MAG: YggT family protein [Cyanobacteria bacterium P01_H01_bin.74]
MPITISSFLITFIEVYKMVLLARILLTWLPSINWYNQPFQFLRDVTDPVMDPFRRLIPPLGGLDLSPILLFIVLNILQGLIRSAL